MTVAFCGHRNVMGVSDIEKVSEQLFKAVEELINQGADEFLLGGRGEFDNLCIYAVSALKKKYPDMHLPPAVPYASLYDCDYPLLGRLLVDKSDVLVAFVKKPCGSAAETLSYAEGKKKRIIRIN